MSMDVPAGSAYLFLGNADGRVKDGPGDDFIASGGGQRSGVAVEFQAAGRNQVPENELALQLFFVSFLVHFGQDVGDGFEGRVILRRYLRGLYIHFRCRSLFERVGTCTKTPKTASPSGCLVAFSIVPYFVL